MAVLLIFDHPSHCRLPLQPDLAGPGTGPGQRLGIPAHRFLTGPRVLPGPVEALTPRSFIKKLAAKYAESKPSGRRSGGRKVCQIGWVAKSPSIILKLASRGTPTSQEVTGIEGQTFPGPLLRDQASLPVSPSLPPSLSPRYIFIMLVVENRAAS